MKVYDWIFGGILLLIAGGLIAGWVLNIWKLFVGLADPVTGLYLLRAIGVLAAPLGGIVGWF